MLNVAKKASILCRAGPLIREIINKKTLVIITSWAATIKDHINMESKGLRRKTKLNALFLFLVFILIYRKFDSRASNRFNQFSSLIYNRTLRAADATRHRFFLFGSAPEEPEIDPVTLVENYLKIEERFENRKMFLREKCMEKNMNVTYTAESELVIDENATTSIFDEIWGNVLAGNLHLNSEFFKYNFKNIFDVFYKDSRYFTDFEKKYFFAQNKRKIIKYSQLCFNG